MMYGPNVKKCERGHPIDSPRCFLCEQEDRDQAAADEKVLATLKRLAAAGKLKGLIGE